MIEILVGMIASGKTTYARRRAKEGAVVISHDDLTEMLHQEYIYHQHLKPFYRDCMLALADAAASRNMDVVIDRTHLTRESRAVWADHAKRRGLRAVAVVFPAGPAHVHAARRFDSDARGRSYLEWHGVAVHHAEQARSEPLDWLAEGFTDRIDIPGDLDI